MKKSLLALAIGVGLPFSAVVAADMNGSSSFGPKAGDNEFTLSGGGNSNKQFDRSTVTLSLIYGKYITDSWQWSIRQGVNVADVANDNQWNGSTRLAVDYHWNFDRWRPLVGLNVGAIYGNNVSDTGIAGPEVGIKYYPKPDTFIYFLEEYQFFFKDSSDVNDNFDNGAFAHNFGVGFNF